MKLKNKISGEIKEFALFDGNELQGGATLESLTEEWEDYEEPKTRWFISSDGGVKECDEDAYWSGEKSIGNYFETKEEAEKAVEKLKAWKRLRDKGLKISAKIHQESYDKKYICLEVNWEVLDGDFSDVFICFGGKK